jgi:glutamate:Na+ symporter, ESS family
MEFSPWWLLAAAPPVLLGAEWLVRRVRVLSRFSIPAPVVGGLVIATIVASLRLSSVSVTLLKEVSIDHPWLWPLRPGLANPQAVFLPLAVGFFTCVGLNASWSVIRDGGWKLALFLLVATALAPIQNIIGIAMAGAQGQPWAFGLVCGSVTLTGGPSTMIGLTPQMEQAGLPGAGEIGAAAAMFGMVAGSLLGGPVATRLIRRRGLRATAIEESVVPPPLAVSPTIPAADSLSAPAPRPKGWLGKLVTLLSLKWETLLILLLLLICIKAGAWVSRGLTQLNITLPVFMGALLVGIAVRNIADAIRPGLLRTSLIDLVGSVILGLFLVMAMMALDVTSLAKVAVPMLTILAVQVVVMALYASWVTFRLMGRDYEAAVMAAGHVGFGLGITPNAVANMETLTQKYGPSPRAFLVVTTVGAFLIDFTNSVVITLFLNYHAASKPL